MQNISQSQFSNVQIVAHPFDTQNEIVTYLDQQCVEIDRLIARKEQIITELESYKKSLIYECVTGKREVE
jgi:type I restriction enzyme S subunit